jgi:hypothetical protein
VRLRTDCLNYFVFGLVQFLKAIASGVEDPIEQQASE